MGGRASAAHGRTIESAIGHCGWGLSMSVSLRAADWQTRRLGLAAMAPRKKPNIEFRIAMEQLRSGLKPALGVARYLQQKAAKSARAKGQRAPGRAGGQPAVQNVERDAGGPPRSGERGGSVGGADAAARLAKLVAEKTARRRYHLQKQLRQAVRKARDFALRKLGRKLKEASAAADGGEAGTHAQARAEARLGALKALSVDWLTHRTLEQSGRGGKEPDGSADDGARRVGSGATGGGAGGEPAPPTLTTEQQAEVGQSSALVTRAAAVVSAVAALRQALGNADGPAAACAAPEAAASAGRPRHEQPVGRCLLYTSPSPRD